MIYKHNNKLFLGEMVGPFVAVKEVTPTELPGVPCHRNTGRPPIPVALMDQIKAFFLWSYAETKSESEIQLFYSDSFGWHAAPMPQERGRGLTVKQIDDTEKRAETMRRVKEEMGGQAMEFAGTGHHHCNIGAFASGTDQNDEKDKEGIHFTIGNLGSDTMSFHARVSLRKSVTPAVYSDWFAMRVELDLAPAVKDVQIGYEICRKPADDVTFPEWWKDQLIEMPRVVYGQFQQQQNRPNGYLPPQSSSAGRELIPEEELWEKVDGYWRPRAKGGTSSKTLEIPYTTALEEVVQVHSLRDLMSTLEYIDDIMQLAVDYKKSSDDVMMSLLNIYSLELEQEGWTEVDQHNVRMGKVTAASVWESLDDKAADAAAAEDEQNTDYDAATAANEK